MYYFVKIFLVFPKQPDYLMILPMCGATAERYGTMSAIHVIRILKAVT